MGHVSCKIRACSDSQSQMRSSTPSNCGAGRQHGGYQQRPACSSRLTVPVRSEASSDAGPLAALKDVLQHGLHGNSDSSAGGLSCSVGDVAPPLKEQPFVS
eukprot:623588-Amphidinium_carterae.1